MDGKGRVRLRMVPAGSRLPMLSRETSSRRNPRNFLCANLLSDSKNLHIELHHRAKQVIISKKDKAQSALHATGKHAHQLGADIGVLYDVKCVDRSAIIPRR